MHLVILNQILIDKDSLLKQRGHFVRFKKQNSKIKTALWVLVNWSRNNATSNLPEFITG